MQYSLDLIRTTLRGLYPPGEIASFTRMILEELCGFTTVDIILHKDTILRDEIHKKIASIVERLSHYEPIQYVLGSTMFCGRRFAVGKGVLIPRPETEELVDCIIRQNQHKKPEYIADYCTGSGCIAITLAKAWEHVCVEGWDISDEALAYARRNACDNEADVEWGIRDVLAYEPQDSASRTSLTSGFTREDLLAIKKATEAAKKEGVEAAREVLKNCDGCSENQEIAPVQFSEIQKHNQQRARQLLTDAEAVKKLLKPTEGAEVEPPLNEQNERTNNLPEAQKTAEAAATEELAATDMSFVFVSASLGEAALRRIIHENAGRADATLVLRGVKKGENLGKAILGIQAMVRELNEKTGETVNILIAPTLFETFRITAVPTVVRAKATQPDPLRKPKYKEIASVKGLANDQWLRSRIETGATGDQGQQGPVYEIVEPDLIEEMKRRAAAIDWEAKKNEAIARYWSNQKYEDFERAEVSRTFEIDPTVIVTADIKDADGVLIRKAGERINPLEIRPFSKEVIFFDATDIEQRNRVQTYARTRDAASKGFVDRIYISSKFDSEKGWDGYKELTDWFDAPLYQLQPGMAERFGVVRLPSVVTADNNRKVFVVKELGREERKTDGPNQTERHVAAEKVEANK